MVSGQGGGAGDGGVAEADEQGKTLVCSECFAALGGGSCGAHPDDPPLDPARPEVRDMLADMDARDLTSLQRKFMSIGAIPAALTLLLVLRVPLGFFLKLFLVGMFLLLTFAGLSLGRRRANRRFKPRFARWTGRDYEMDEDIDGLLEASRPPWMK